MASSLIFVSYFIPCKSGHSSEMKPETSTKYNFSGLCCRVGIMSNSLIASHYKNGGDLVDEGILVPFILSTKNNPISYDRPLFLIVALIFQPNISIFLILLFLSLTFYGIDSLDIYAVRTFLAALFALRCKFSPLEFRITNWANPAKRLSKKPQLGCRGGAFASFFTP